MAISRGGGVQRPAWHPSGALASNEQTRDQEVDPRRRSDLTAWAIKLDSRRCSTMVIKNGWIDGWYYVKADGYLNESLERD